MSYDFYGWKHTGGIHTGKNGYEGIDTPTDLYDKLKKIWCADTCAPRMRENWTPDNYTMGQCSITAFLAQDIFGGQVYAMPTDNGGVHCYNVVDGVIFDLTSEQFGERAKSLVYDCSMLQDRESSMHFGKAEKRQRYEYLKSRLQPVSKGHFYYVRHGQTVWNVENKICGATDSPLTEAGRNQAKEVAEKILAEGLHIDEILYSPLSRARDTAMEISKAIGVPARVEVRLVEQDFGKWEGTARNGEAFRLAKQSFATSNEGGESMLKLCQRIYNLMDELKKEPDKVRLLVAHNGIARAVQSYFTDMTNEEFAAFGIRNCEIRRYDFAQEGKQTGREDG